MSALHACHITPIQFTKIKQGKVSLGRILGSRSTQGQEHAILSLLPFGTTSRSLFVHPLQLGPSGNISEHISLTWSFRHRHQHAWCSVDVTQLLHRFCCWTPILVVKPLDLTSRGYCRYRNLIDWLIDIQRSYSISVRLSMHLIVGSTCFGGFFQCSWGESTLSCNPFKRSAGWLLWTFYRWLLRYHGSHITAAKTYGALKYVFVLVMLVHSFVP